MYLGILVTGGRITIDYSEGNPLKPGPGTMKSLQILKHQSAAGPYRVTRIGLYYI